MRTDLQSGAWIEHRPIGDLKRKDKRLLSEFKAPDVAGAIGPSGEVDMAAVIAGMDVMSYVAGAQDFCWALLLTAWSYDLPLPAVADGQLLNAESFGELPIDDADEIERVFAPYQAKLTRRPDPKGTTTSSSNGALPAGAAPPSLTA